MLGLTQSKYDPALIFDKQKKLYATLYVDDFKAISPNEESIVWFKREFGSIYKTKYLGLASSYLGVKIKQSDHLIKLTQKRYLQYVLERFKMQNCKAVKTPMEDRTKLYKAEQDHQCSPDDRWLYQELEGCLMHLSVQTRPDITHAVNKLGQFAANPTKQHWNALLRILRYLKETPNHGLTYGKEHSLTLQP